MVHEFFSINLFKTRLKRPWKKWKKKVNYHYSSGKVKIGLGVVEKRKEEGEMHCRLVLPSSTPVHVHTHVAHPCTHTHHILWHTHMACTTHTHALTHTIYQWQGPGYFFNVMGKTMTASFLENFIGPPPFVNVDFSLLNIWSLLSRFFFLFLLLFAFQEHIFSK